jgi:hypothetical protein
MGAQGQLADGNQRPCAGRCVPPGVQVRTDSGSARPRPDRADRPSRSRLPVPGHPTASAERYRPCSRPRGTPSVPIPDARNTARKSIRDVVGRRGTLFTHPGPADGPADSSPAGQRRGPGARMVWRNRFRRSSPAASSRAARRTDSSAYAGRSPDDCPVAFSFATAWFKFTPTRRTPSAARSKACTASASGTSGAVTAPRAMARVASAAYAPRASPACRAAVDTSAYSSSVSANRTVRDRRA